MALVTQILNKGISLSDDLARYLKICGKTSVLQTKPVNPTQLKRLYFKPQVLDDIPIAMRKSMNLDEALLMYEQSSKRGFSAINREIDFVINGKQYTGTWLGGGGSKSAYKTTILDEEICLLLPNKNWETALREPSNMLELKKMGLLTNDYCKIVPIKVDGKDFPALMMKPYAKHSFKIFDKKNPNDFLEKYIDLNNLDTNKFNELISDLVKDAKLMSKNKIMLHYDSYNIALVNNKPRLYLNDLPYEQGKMISNCEYEKILKYNLRQSLQALNGAFGWNASKQYPFLKNLESSKGIDTIIENLLH